MPKNRICFTSIDVEDRGIEESDKILGIFKENDISATLFVTGEVLAKYPELIKKWSKDYEIACHSYTHRFWNTLSRKEREEELAKFISLYQSIFQASPKGFRAPSHIIDKEAFNLLSQKGFLYDSSVVPHYPPFKKYRGHKGRAPLSPYDLNGLLEIPVSGQLLGLPMAGAWIRGLPVWIYRILFLIHRPDFITLNMHSWDVLDECFLSKLKAIVKILERSGYQFSNGEQILKNRK